MITWSGSVASGFESVVEAWAEDTGGYDTGGSSLAIEVGGVPIVDVWGGRDPLGDRSWERDSAAVVFSCTKAVTAVSLLRLVDRGLVDLGSPVARYWPEFGAHGKHGITVRHVLTHTSGLPDLRISAREELVNPVAIAASLANREALHPPGQHWMYHALSFGYLVGELVRRVTGRSISEVVQKEIAAPLDLDFWIGVPGEFDSRVLPAHYANGPPLGELPAEFAHDDLVSSAWRSGTEVLQLVVPRPGEGRGGEFINQRAFRSATIPGGNGAGTARALARFYSACLGEVDGVRLLSESLLDEATRDQTTGVTLTRVETERKTFGLGLDLSYAANPMLGTGSFGHAGMGGRLAFGHRPTGVTLGYVSTELQWFPDSIERRWPPFLDALRAVVG